MLSLRGILRSAASISALQAAQAVLASVHAGTGRSPAITPAAPQQQQQQPAVLAHQQQQQQRQLPLQPLWAQQQQNHQQQQPPWESSTINTPSTGTLTTFLRSCSRGWSQCTLLAMHSCTIHASQCWYLIRCSQQCTSHCSSQSNHNSMLCSMTVTCRCWFSCVGGSSTAWQWFVCWG